MKNQLFSIAMAVLAWTLGVSIYLLSYSLPILDSPELQANLALATGVIPCAALCTYLFYRRGKMAPSMLAMRFVLVAALLDALITVPLFIIPAGGSYAGFFGHPMFYIIVAEFFIVVSLVGNSNAKNLAQ